VSAQASQLGIRPQDVGAGADPAAVAARPEDACRLCGAATTGCFVLPVLGKYQVEYRRCIRCGSLQTEKPYWLDEAYAHNLSHLDTGAAQRNFSNLAACYALAKLFGLKNAVDVGGGDGLLCRLLRDYGINCFVKDKYAAPNYAQGFTEPDFAVPDLVIASELLEHLANPAAELGAIFDAGPTALLVTTAIYSGQGPDWWYLAPESGQHVFFYSKTGVELIARNYGYRLLMSGGYLLFIRQERLSPPLGLAARLLMKARVRALVKARLALAGTSGTWADHLRQKSKVGRP